MSLTMRILLIAGSLLTAFYVLRRVRRSRMRTEDSIFWLSFSLILVLMGLFPGLVTSLAAFMGVISAANLVFLIVIFFLLIKLFLMDQRISALQRQVTETAQTVAVQAVNRVSSGDEKKAANGGQDDTDAGNIRA
ncbi:MAG: DUF2304 domain-containing protein [Clostridia bacterium]|nr:DUF2304 domain-containing protein [Clostridia bacterium]